MSSKFSSALNLTDLNDFITPAQSCVRPPAYSAAANASETQQGSMRVQLGYDEMGMGPASQAAPKGEPVTISLSDCLACSGCITSAESVLVNQQTTDEFLHYLQSAARSSSLVAISISPQSRASFAAKYNMDILSTARRLTWFLKRILKVDCVFDISVAKDLCLIASADEFLEKRNSCALPVITSICPGWICYAEKTHPNLLPLISRIKSPQQIQGSLLKRLDLGLLLKNAAAQCGASSPCSEYTRVYHVTVMPCYDKKLEASRSDFYDHLTGSKEVDCVLTTGELEKIILQHGYSLGSLEQAADPYDLPFSTMHAHAGMGDTDIALLRTEGSGTGGYLEHILKRAGLDLLHRHVALSEIKVTTLRNKDCKEYRLQDESGCVLLTFVAAYGFRHIQNIVKRLKDRKESDPKIDYIELMACPSSCLNGGGQLEPEPEPEPGCAPLLSFQRKLLLSRVESAYASLPTREPQEHPNVARIIHDHLDGSTLSAKAKDILRTEYHAIPATPTARIHVKW